MKKYFVYIKNSPEASERLRRELGFNISPSAYDGYPYLLVSCYGDVFGINGQFREESPKVFDTVDEFIEWYREADWS